MLKKVSFANSMKNLFVEAYSDTYSYDLSNRIALLSICGFDSTVKAISSAVITRNYITLDCVDITCSNKCKYKILSTKLESGLLHQIVLSELFLNHNSNNPVYLVNDKKETFYKSFFLKLKQKFAVPMVSEWGQWLHKKLSEEKMVEELSGNISVVSIDTTEEDLERIIIEGIKSRSISF